MDNALSRKESQLELCPEVGQFEYDDFEKQVKENKEN